MNKDSPVIGHYGFPAPWVGRDLLQTKGSFVKHIWEDEEPNIKHVVGFPTSSVINFDQHPTLLSYEVTIELLNAIGANTIHRLPPNK